MPAALLHETERAKALNSATIAETIRRSAIAARVCSPCRYAPFRSPLGAPLPSAPPCIRQRRLSFTAGDRHADPSRVFAPHFGQSRSVSGWQLPLCMGLVRSFIRAPSPFTAATGASDDVADDRLRTRMHMHNLDDLLAAALQLGERLGLHGKRAQQLHGRVAGALELRDLIDAQRAMQDRLRGVMRQRHLDRERGLHLVSRRRTFDHGKQAIQLGIVDIPVAVTARHHNPVNLRDREILPVRAEYILEAMQPTLVIVVRATGDRQHAFRILPALGRAREADGRLRAS